MVNDDLSLAASTALNRCRSEHTSVTYTGITADCASGRKTVDLTVVPVPGKGKEGKTESGLVAVLFLENKNVEQEGITEKYDMDTMAAQRIADLEQELYEFKNDLKATIGELETVNEERYTVNTEYQQKLDELTMLTNDLSNFLSSAMIGILFVDGALNIRKFTEYVGREFQLMEHDAGRPQQIFVHSFPNEDIISDGGEVLKPFMPIDREVTSMNGRYYTLRILLLTGQRKIISEGW